MHASGGLLNRYDGVGWDWWLGVHDPEPHGDTWDGGVVAWIPDEHVAAIQAGIDANPEGCLRWIDEHDVVLHAQGAR
jgi:hypothetical protein